MPQLRNTVPVGRGDDVTNLELATGRRQAVCIHGCDDEALTFVGADVKPQLAWLATVGCAGGLASMKREGQFVDGEGRFDNSGGD